MRTELLLSQHEKKKRRQHHQAADYSFCKFGAATSRFLFFV
jgi:hypothetical protein